MKGRCSGLKTVIVAGAGHGGLCAAIRLSQNGYRVTVLEQKAREHIGYDWHDVLHRSTFVNAHIPVPDDALFLPGEHMCYYSTAKRVKVVSPRLPGRNEVYMDRQALLDHLIDAAAEKGVTFLFGCRVLDAVCGEGRVLGVRYECGGETRTLRGDLVIDAAGVYSSVRQSLPASFGVPRKLSQHDLFFAWRGYFAVRKPCRTDPPYSIYFFHCGTPGMDWVLTRDDHADVLVGGFGSLDAGTVEAHLADFRADYPDMTDELLRGGSIECIPLGKTLPVFVCGGYAAVGNAAGMTEPLSGSGIDMSLRAGKMLADTVIAAGGNTDAEALWEYNRRYMQKVARSFYTDLLLRKFLMTLSASDIDFLFDNRILTEKELGGKRSGYTAKQLLQKANLMRRPALVRGIADMLRRMRMLDKMQSALPARYAPAAVGKWAKKYEAVFG